MPNIDLSILNQRQTPAFFADTLANRPAAGFLGRIFVSTDTFEFYRDNGTGWNIIGGPGTGTITGSGAAGQVSYFSGTSSITGNNNLFWDSVNGHLGIGTNAPGTALQINHGQSQLIRLNQTTATNDTKIAFQNSGVALWRIGNSYNAGANDYAVFDVVSNLERFSIKTTGQTFIGAQTTTSGRLVVNNATGDNHIVVIGATAPSLRINNSGTGATKLIGIGLATATNNFIQGAVDRDMAIFNGSTTASPMLFGIYDAGAGNVQEAARISAARNFLVGSSVDGGQRFQVTGTTQLTGATTILVPTNTVGLTVTKGAPNDGIVRFTPSGNVSIIEMITQSINGTISTNASDASFNFLCNTQGANTRIGNNVAAGGGLELYFANNGANADCTFYTGRPASRTQAGRIFTLTGNWNIGNSTTDAGFKLDVNGTSIFRSTATFATSPTMNSINDAGNNFTINRANSAGFVQLIGGAGVTIKADKDTTSGGTNSVQLSGNCTIIGATLLTPNASAQLQVDSTVRGFLPPRMTTAQKNAIGTPATGLVIYDTTLNKLAVFTGVNWETVTSV
jgi:hypothetical protein